MPWRLILSAVIAVLVITFIGFNLDDANKCNISLVFFTMTAVPVYMTALVSFAAGLLIMLPFTFSFVKKHKKTAVVPQKDSSSHSDASQSKNEPKTDV